VPTSHDPLRLADAMTRESDDAGMLRLIAASRAIPRGSFFARSSSVPVLTAF
jgi:hypothetical protein